MAQGGGKAPAAPRACKPEVCIVGDRLAVFIGADYKFLELEQAQAFVRRMQGELAKLQRQAKRAARARRKLLEAARA